VGVWEVPSFVIYAPDGRILRVRQGRMDADSFRGMVVAAQLAR
jgi:hypothetical protein